MADYRGVHIPDEELRAAREAAAIGEAAMLALSTALTAHREALAAALALAALYPAPTPEETAIIDAQVAAALAGFRALDNPPADVVALAAAVVSWRTEV